MKKLFSLLLAICLIAGLLPIVASAAEASISFLSGAGDAREALSVTEGGEAKYMITEGGFAHSQTATAANYNIKFVWPAGGNPTIYLKGAQLKGTDNQIAVSISSTATIPLTYVFHTEEESTIEAGTNAYGIRSIGAHMSFTGDAKLNLIGNRSFAVGIYQADVADNGPKFDITLDNANIELTLNMEKGDFGAGFGNHIRDFTIDGGKLKANLVNGSAFYSNTPGQNSNLHITNSAEIDVQGTGTAGFVRVENGIYIDSGNIKIRHSGTSAFYAGKEFKITGGTIDVVGGPFSYSPDAVGIDFSEYVGDYTAIVCNSADGKGAVQFDPEKVIQQARYVYFKVTPGASYEVAVKNGTADKSVVEAGATVTITARIAPEGKAFDKWVVDNGDITLADPTASSTTFVMPKENVKVTATYKDLEVDEPDTDTTPDNDNTPDNTPDTDTTPDNDNTQNTEPTDTTPDNTDKNEGNKKPAKEKNPNAGILALFIVMIVVLVLAIAAVVVFTLITMKRMGIQLFKGKTPAAEAEAAEEAEETTEE